MDPLHITEFASDRYFQKLEQLQDTSGNHQQQEHAAEGPVATPPPLLQSTFILPLRESQVAEESSIKPPEQKRSERSRFLGFRSRRLLSRSSTTSSPVPVTELTGDFERRVSLADSAKQRYVAAANLFITPPSPFLKQSCSLARFPYRQFPTPISPLGRPTDLSLCFL